MIDKDLKKCIYRSNFDLVYCWSKLQNSGTQIQQLVKGQESESSEMVRNKNESVHEL